MPRPAPRISSTRAKRLCLIAAAGGALMLAGCKSEPAGQVAATVNGDEITLTELNAELASVQVPENADKKMLQRQALERIVERKLLAEAARNDGLDQTPEFIVRRQQLEDALLVQLMTQKAARGIKVPTTTALNQYMASNPAMFAGREILTVDQIRFAPPKDEGYLKQLAAAHSMADVIATLDRLGIKYERGNAGIDTAQVPRPMLDQIRAVPAGEPFVIPLGNMVTVSLVTGKQAAPLTGDAAGPIAANAARNAQLAEQMQERLKTERAKAEIKYQPGFSPPAKTPGAPGAPAAPAK